MSDLVPPPGYKPGHTLAPLIWNIALPIASIAIFLACLRFYVRACLTKVFGKDDWLLLAAVILLSVNLSGVVWAVISGAGRYRYDLHYTGPTYPAFVVCCSPFYKLIFGFSLFLFACV